MKYTLACIFLFLVSFRGLAQTAALAEQLRIEWQPIQNNYKGATKSLSALRLSGPGMAGLPAAGWSLLFNFDREIEPAEAEAAGVEIRRIQGGWYILKIKSATIPLEIPLVSEYWLVNKSDAPKGFYLISDDDTALGFPVHNVSIVPPSRTEQWPRNSDDKVTTPSPSDLYRQNLRAPDLSGREKPQIFPQPSSMRPTDGFFKLTAETPIVADPAFKNEARLFAAEWPVFFGKNAKLSFKKRKKGPGIYIRKSEKPLKEEAYMLNVSPNEITVQASSSAGAFYGLQSLRTLFPPEIWQKSAPEIQLPCMEVQDRPRFGYRGLHLDVARNFMQKEEVLKIVDLMALYKLNTLHLHFNDDEGWRIEIPGLPELTEYGGRRGHSIAEKEFLSPAYGSGPHAGALSGSGFYTRDEFVEMLRFAARRHVKVIPEIELPGHARAAIKAMDAKARNPMGGGRQYLLSDKVDLSVYKSVQGYNDNVICVGLPSAYAFIEKVVDELRLMYRTAGAPLQTIHLGGDEVPAGAWEKSLACVRYMREHHLANVDELWTDFWLRMRDMLQKKQLTLSGWEEIGMRKISENGQKKAIPDPNLHHNGTSVYVWNNVIGWGAEDLAYQLANAGYKTVLVPVSHLYFDMAYQKAFEEPGYYWGGFTELDKTFSFAPLNYFQTIREDAFGRPLQPDFWKNKQKLTAKGRENILGIQGALWSETITTPAGAEYMLFPRLLALAWRAWTAEEPWETSVDAAETDRLFQQSWAEFANRLGKRELPRLDFYGGGVHYRIPSPGAEVREGMLYANIQLPGLTLRYTLDGSEPNKNSPVYTQPIPVSGTVKIKAFDRRGRAGRTTRIKV